MAARLVFSGGCGLCASALEGVTGRLLTGTRVELKTEQGLYFQEVEFF